MRSLTPTRLNSISSAPTPRHRLVEQDLWYALKAVWRLFFFSEVILSPTQSCASARHCTAARPVHPLLYSPAPQRWKHQPTWKIMLYSHWLFTAAKKLSIPDNQDLTLWCLLVCCSCLVLGLPEKPLSARTLCHHRWNTTIWKFCVYIQSCNEMLRQIVLLVLLLEASLHHLYLGPERIWSHPSWIPAPSYDIMFLIFKLGLSEKRPHGEYFERNNPIVVDWSWKPLFEDIFVSFYELVHPVSQNLTSHKPFTTNIKFRALRYQFTSKRWCNDCNINMLQTSLFVGVF